MNEVWANVKKYKGRYKVSNYGQVMSLKRKRVKENTILTGHIYMGRKYVHLRKNGKGKSYPLAHIVLYTFRDELRAKRIALHLDGNTLNDIERNLKWSTRGDACRYKNHILNQGHTNYKAKEDMGVYKYPHGKKHFRVAIKKNGKYKTIGYTNTKEEAKLLYFVSFNKMFGYYPY